MCVLTCMVTLAISTNVVISLGMVGALSIVRYRTAVKDPLDLLYLFWAITTGITAGAGMYALVELAAVVIMAMIADFASHQDKARVYMMVIHYTGQTTSDDIVRAFVRTKFTVKSKTMHGDKVEMAVEVFSDGVDMPYADAIRALDGVEDLTLLQYNGEYHGYSLASRLHKEGRSWSSIRQRAGGCRGEVPRKRSDAYFMYASDGLSGRSPGRCPRSVEQSGVR